MLERTRSGLMEQLTVYFDPGLTDADRGRWETVWSRFMGVMAAHAPGFHGVAAGWLVEAVQYDGQDATAFVALLGWDTVEMHRNFRATTDFQENVGPLRHGCKAMAMHHVVFQEAKRSQLG